MFDSLMKMFGLAKPARKKVQLPDGLNHLEVIPARGWWS